ncbi:hypothetical protein FA95DRAFT_1602310 [Auriscalpium vulgare]|uniref:Uncharacterized protein n=1 Tax=Auriscalpium vulgare TaxID=40419 RepID=A0ACB8S7B0_9AGAM|nr:hypothetical protein FA95DRAFT_1602310 [Auriscalpium vulgare]
MPIAVAVWSLVVRPGEPQSVVPETDVVITNIALGEELDDEKSRTTVKFTYARPVSVDDSDDEKEDDDEPGSLGVAVLGSLTPGKIEQASVNVTLEENEEYLFEVVGKNTIHLTGNYIDQSPDNVPFNDESEPEDEDEDEDGFDLRDVSSDVEIDPAELDVPSDEDDAADRFEEIEETASAKPAKRARESDDLSKKKAKKLKAENGTALASGSEANGAEEPKKDKKDKKEKKEKKDKGKEVNAPAEASPMKELSGGLKVQDMKVGTGPQAKKGSVVYMRYIGKLQNGKVFDSNTKGKPFVFKLGQGSVIKGWDQGIAGMAVGGERLLIVPPSLGYGSKKNDAIPANSTLRFECKLVDIK